MIFNRVTLRDAAQQALIGLRAKYDERVRKYEDLQVESEIEWIGKYGPGWVDACKVITAKIERGEPITQSDLPLLDEMHRPRGIPAFYDGPRSTQRRLASEPSEYIEPPELRKLLVVLDLSTDEIVSTHGLKELGIGQRTMGMVMDHIRESGTLDKK